MVLNYIIELIILNDIIHIIFLDFILIQKDIIKAYLLKWHKGVLYAYKKYLNLFKNKIFWKWLQSIQINYSDFYKFLQFYLNRFGGLIQNLEK